MSQTTQIMQRPLKQNPPVSQKIWQIAFAAITVIFAILSKKIYHFRMDQANASFIRGSYLHFIICIPTMIINHLIRDYIISKFKSSIQTQLCQKRFSLPEKRKQRAKLLSKWLIDIVYYLLASIAGVYIMINQQSFPNVLEGNFQCRNVLSQIIPKNIEVILELYYLVQFSNHLYSLIIHIYTKDVYGKTKYYQYCLHHSFAVFLIFYSYMFNLWIIGTMVLIFHDFSDSFLIFGRFYLDMKFRNNYILYLIYAGVLFIWIFNRLFMFPKCCILPVFELDNIPFQIAYMVSMEIGLWIMHIYWTYFFLGAIKQTSKRKNEY